MAVDHHELRAIRLDVYQTLTDSGGDYPGILIPLEDILQEYDKSWQPVIARDSRGRAFIRRVAKPVGTDKTLYSDRLLPKGADDSFRRLHAQLQGLRAYLTDHATEQAILNAATHGPLGIPCLPKEQSDEPVRYPEVGEIWDPRKSQGALVGAMVGSAITHETYRMCVDAKSSPITDNALAQFIFLSGIFAGNLGNRLDELQAMPHDELLSEASPYFGKLSNTGPVTIGQFAEVATKVIGPRSPRRYSQIVLDNADALRWITSLKAKPTSTLPCLLAWDGTGEMTATNLPDEGLAWNERYVDASGTGRNLRLAFSATARALIDPHTGRTFHQDNRLVHLDASLIFSSEGCVATERVTDTLRETALHRDGMQREAKPQFPPSFHRAAAMVVRALEHTTVFNPHGRDFRDFSNDEGPYVFGGPEGLREVDEAIAFALTEGKALRAERNRRRPLSRPAITIVPGRTRTFKRNIVDATKQNTATETMDGLWIDTPAAPSSTHSPAQNTIPGLEMEAELAAIETERAEAEEYTVRMARSTALKHRLDLFG